MNQVHRRSNICTQVMDCACSCHCLSFSHSIAFFSIISVCVLCTGKCPLTRDWWCRNREYLVPSSWAQDMWSLLSGHVQDQECTGCLGACRAPTDLQRVTQGECVPAEWLSRNVILYKLKYIQEGDFTWVGMRRKLPSHSPWVWLYITDG